MKKQRASVEHIEDNTSTMTAPTIDGARQIYSCKSEPYNKENLESEEKRSNWGYRSKQTYGKNHNP